MPRRPELSTRRAAALASRVQAEWNLAFCGDTDVCGWKRPHEIEGPGTIVGVGNANPVSLESYERPERKAWQGRCLVIVKSGIAPATSV